MALILPAETVDRSPPQGLVPGDEGLFRHEYRRVLAPVEAVEADVDFLPQGLLLHPGTARLSNFGFQEGIPGGLTGLKVRLRAAEALLRFPRVDFSPNEGRRPLVLTDEFSNGFFHWVGDVLPKLVLLGAELSHYELILPSYSRRFRYMEESLALWPELKWTVLEPKTRLALKGARILTALAPTGNYRPALMKVLGEAWRTRTGSLDAHRLVYVSRAKAPWRKLRNENEVWAALEERGFERVFLEDLSFADQVKLAAETKFLLSNHGAGLTDMAFMVPGSRVLEIRLTGDAHNNCYYALASALNLKYSYLTAPPARGGRDVHTADLQVDVSALLRILEVPA